MSVALGRGGGDGGGGTHASPSTLRHQSDPDNKSSKIGENEVNNTQSAMHCASQRVNSRRASLGFKWTEERYSRGQR